MSLLVLDGVGLSFGSRVLFDDLSLRIDRRDRVGLIGPNGSGKTTLMRILAGEQGPDRGAAHRPAGVQIGYLPQDLDVAGGISLRELVLSSVPGRVDLDRRLAETEAALEAAQPGGDSEELLELAAEIADIHEKIAHFERYYAEHEALRILAGLGFEPGEEDRDVGELSGGWRMRAVLAALLFQKPDLMLLDEPTNHLDLPSVAWFADFLKRSQQAFVLISHDREFLDEQIDRVVSLEVEGVRSYAGNYEKYLEQRAEEEELLENRAKNLERERERMERFINRFRAQANKASAVQSRVKALAKLEDVELYRRRKVARFSFPPVGRTVSEVARIEGLAKSYGDHQVFAGIDLQVGRGEKIAIIGPNGAGKTTLLKIVAGELGASAGQVRIGSGIEIGYYAQHHADTLDRDATAYQAVSRANPDASPNQIRSVLGAFLFSGDDVDKKVSVLSGGERARVALARLLIKPGNFLLMDEPTNHLDLDTSESLAESLSGFGGALLFVSHNRSLIRTLATRIWNIEDGRVETYPGTLDEYLYSCQLRRRGEVEENGAPTDGAPAAAPELEPEPDRRANRADAKARKRREAEARKLRHQLVGPIEQRIATIEERVAALEAEQALRSQRLADPTVYDDAAQRNQLLSSYQAAAAKIEELTARWEGLTEELEAVSAELESRLAALDPGV
jgi:ATP-binding cassette subfamily F protein 3